ncbi:hypothetical protein [Arthrobacter sp. H5]|uniref:Trm112 family protein n=1 Tax=Arthrobacter sp. H5 TaxID=1267973 RepID=UPI000486C213|nr:hypothetical protein [Arthrobacter sp. H5]
MALISPDLLALLRCPVTGSSLVQEDDQLLSSAPDPSGTRLKYTIDEGIPVLLRPELLPAADAAGSDQHDAPVADTSH